jgi:ubiquinone/menaquinone biosynthesis C-methylase UbiE
MSPVERAFCRSAPWRRFAGSVVLPWALQGVRPEGKLLEIGGGSGAMAAVMLERHPDLSVTVTDIDPAMVESASRRLDRFRPRAAARQADATALPFEDGSFDTVVSFIMLHHVGAWEQALAEAVRVLRPGGMLLGYDLAAIAPLQRLHRLDRSPHRFVAPDELARVLRSLPVDEVRTSRDLGGLVTRFRAERTRG